MFADNLTLDDASGDDVVYALISQDGTGTRRVDVASTSQEPAFMEIRHETTGARGNQIDRHLVKFTRTELDSNLAPVTVTANFTLAVPRSAAITNQICYDLVSNMLDFLASGALTSVTTTNLEALIRGES